MAAHLRRRIKLHQRVVLVRLLGGKGQLLRPDDEQGALELHLRRGEVGVGAAENHDPQPGDAGAAHLIDELVDGRALDEVQVVDDHQQGALWRQVVKHVNDAEHVDAVLGKAHSGQALGKGGVPSGNGADEQEPEKLCLRQIGGPGHGHPQALQLRPLDIAAEGGCLAVAHGRDDHGQGM